MKFTTKIMLQKKICLYMFLNFHPSQLNEELVRGDIFRQKTQENV